MPVEGVPLTDSVSDERLDGDLMLCGIKHDKIVEGDRPLDAEGLGVTVPSTPHSLNQKNECAPPPERIEMRRLGSAGQSRVSPGSSKNRQP